MAITTFQIPTIQQVMQAMTTDYRSISTNFGYNLSIDPGSELAIRYQGLANQIGVLYNLTNVFVNSKLIDTATGADLDRVANDFGLFRKSATSSSGYVLLVASTPQTLLLGALLTAPNGLSFQVSQTGTYQPGTNVPVSSVDLGSSTNLPPGTIMTWQTPQVNMQGSTTVSIAITNGEDAEDDNALRSRLYLTMQNPPQNINNQGLITLAGSSDGVIQQAFVYGNFNGAGTALIALTGYQTTSYIGRDIPHLPTDGYVSIWQNTPQLTPGLVAQGGLVFNGKNINGYGPYNQYSLGTPNATVGQGEGNPGPNLSNDTSVIYGQIPGTVANTTATVVTTVNNIPTTLSVALQLPYPVGTQPTGFGNGWMDSTPWPVPDGWFVASGACKVLSIQGVGYSIPGGNGQTGFGITVQAPSSGLVHTLGNQSPGENGTAPIASLNVGFSAYNAQVPTPGLTHIQWVDRSDYNDTGWTIKTATVLDAFDNGLDGYADSWSIVLDTVLEYPAGITDFYNQTGIIVNSLIFPACVNAQNYLDTVMQQYALLGPGECTANQGLLLLGATRYPGASAQFPSTIGVQLQKALEVNFNEVFSAICIPNTGLNIPVASRDVVGTAPYFGVCINTAYNTPGITSPPNIFIPQEIGFYPISIIGYGV